MRGDLRRRKFCLLRGSVQAGCLVVTIVRPLAALAEDAGFSAADLAFLADLQESTIGRLWHDPDWLDRVTGRSLKAIATALPGVWEYARQISSVQRLMALASDLADNDVQVNIDAVQHLISTTGTPEQYVASAFQAAIHIIQGDEINTARQLIRFWGRDQDLALSALFDCGPNGLLDDSNALLHAAGDVAEALKERTGSFHAFMGYTTVVHHTAKSTGQLINDRPFSADQQTAFLKRSGTIGLVLSTNDPELVDRYATDLEGSSIASLVEDWALPAYTRDVPASSNFYLPRSTSLRRTAAEVISEINTFNDAYVYYLAKVYIPRAQRHDPALGGRLPDLVKSLSHRRQSCSEQTGAQIDTVLEDLQKADR